ncbi:MAG: lytic transglycosylase domain-containing protein [Christensenellales bacterium]
MKKKLVISLCSCGLAIILILILFYLFFEIKYPLKYENDIRFFAAENELQASLVAAIINTESGFNPNAKSQSGAEGLMQLMPRTARFVANKYAINFESNDLFNPQKNIEIGCKYLRYLFNKFNDKKTVLFAYNSGEGNVVNWLQNQDFSNDGKKLASCPFFETNTYVQRVERAEKIYIKKISAN